MFKEFVILLILQNFFLSVNSYRFAIRINTRCGDIPCKDNNTHTICRKDVVSSNCRSFSMMPYNKKFLLSGHNGIRNKIASNWKISNYNLLHWSKDLELMAEMFIKRCQLIPDACDFIGVPQFTVGQNLFVSQKPPNNINGYEQTYTFVIREWYRELGPDIKSFEQFINTHRKVDHFTNMIWPTTEFMGCSGGRMFHGFTVACYYHPAAEPAKLESFEPGKPCSQCSVDRPTCSLDFHSLCGLDFVNHFSDGPVKYYNHYTIIILIIFLLFIL